MHKNKGTEKKNGTKGFDPAPNTHTHTHVKLIIKRTGLSYFHKLAMNVF